MRRAHRAWESIQTELQPQRSRTVDRRVRAHQRVLDKWNDALDKCDDYGGGDDNQVGNSIDSGHFRATFGAAFRAIFGPIKLGTELQK